MKMVTLNIRRKGSRKKQRELNKLLARKTPVVVALQETMLQKELDESIKCLWRHSDLGYDKKFSSGGLGRLLIL